MLRYRIWTRPAAPTMTHLFNETLELIAELPARSSPEFAASVPRQRDTIDRNFDKIRDLADGVLLEFRREREYDLTARSRIRSWQPLIRIIFMLRIAILRHGWIEDTGADDPRVAEAIAVSSRVLREVRGMTTVDVSGTPDPPLAACVVPILHAEINEPPIVRIAVSLASLSAYLRDNVLLDIFS